MQDTKATFVSVRIPGKRKVEVKLGDLPKDATVKDALVAAAETLGLAGFDVLGVAILVDGKPAEADTPVEDVQKVDATPKARLG
jgi:hypothetical protein